MRVFLLVLCLSAAVAVGAILAATGGGVGAPAQQATDSQTEQSCFYGDLQCWVVGHTPTPDEPCFNGAALQCIPNYSERMHVLFEQVQQRDAP